MRVKINDKIYRLKEIESGFDSLMELVEEPKFKDGDFVYEDGRIMIVKSHPNIHHAIARPIASDKVIYNRTYAVDFSDPTFRYATAEEKQEFIELLRKDGKRWNEWKKCIEDIPKRKFKKGDKVVLKSGYKKSDGLIYLDVFDLFIGKPLTIRGYNDIGNVYFSDCLYIFEEDWLEPYEELKKGDLAIFWNGVKKYATIRIYDRSNESAEYLLHKDIQGLNWSNAIKFESKEQYERFINGEL